MKESQFQKRLINKIKSKFEGCMVIKNDPAYIQGLPDLTILYKNKWAALECKKDSKAHHQPNQEYYIQKMNEMSYASFVSPETEEEVLDGLESAFND